MATARFTSLVTSFTRALYSSNLRSVLSSAIVALGVSGAVPAYAGMGENEATTGVTLAAQPNTIVLACVLGGACADPSDGVLYRLLSADVASQVFRGGATVEFDQIIRGIGFGSFRSSRGTLIDTFCWSGVRRTNPGGRSSQGVRDCIRIFQVSSGSTSLSGGTVVTVRRSASECSSVAAQFTRPPASGFHYLVKLDPRRYGQQGSVEVVACSNNVVARFSSDPTESGIRVDAHRSVSGFDCKLKIGGVCYT